MKEFDLTFTLNLVMYFIVLILSMYLKNTTTYFLTDPLLLFLQERGEIMPTTLKYTSPSGFLDFPTALIYFFLLKFCFILLCTCLDMCLATL